mmetsp:Transcript_97334/g.280853  ORF Transcript_97334/g.280853 Transcript_97334/m.280853 type:complete len:111 (+) Transcript_97334:80-412(+)
MSSSVADRLKEYHRSLRPKKGDEVSMKQVAYFFGGLYAVIHLLQYFDLWTLLIVATVGYVLYRHVQNTMQQWNMNSNEEASAQQPASREGAKPTKSKGANSGKKSGGKKS